eukprot:1974695-Rhodomonas_salina.2
MNADENATCSVLAPGNTRLKGRMFRRDAAATAACSRPFAVLHDCNSGVAAQQQFCARASTPHCDRAGPALPSCGQQRKGATRQPGLVQKLDSEAQSRSQSCHSEATLAQGSRHHCWKASSTVTVTVRFQVLYQPGLAVLRSTLDPDSRPPCGPERSSYSPQSGDCLASDLGRAGEHVTGPSADAAPCQRLVPWDGVGAALTQAKLRRDVKDLLVSDAHDTLADQQRVADPQADPVRIPVIVAIDEMTKAYQLAETSCLDCHRDSRSWPPAQWLALCLPQPIRRAPCCTHALEQGCRILALGQCGERRHAHCGKESD